MNFRVRTSHFSRVCAAGMILGTIPAAADVVPAPLFADHMVLQAEQQTPIWGSAVPGEKVTVFFSGETVSCTTDATGHWEVRLSAHPASSVGLSMRIVGANEIEIRDILMGEVWLCSGQSNMEFTVSRGKDAAAEIASADHPQIRQFLVERSTVYNAEGVKGAWQVCSPASASSFTAVGYYFARALQTTLHVPIGLIHSSWGGSRIEAWIDERTLHANRGLRTARERWEPTLVDYPVLFAKYKDERTRRDAGGDMGTRASPIMAEPVPPRLYSRMIAPLAPFGVKGVLWYQGEANASYPEEYRDLFEAMVDDWRSLWRQSSMPFVFAQLPGFRAPWDKSGYIWAFFREAQAKSQSLDNVFMAVTSDVGDPENIHPTNKQEVARRLALIAESKVYGVHRQAAGPCFENARLEGREFVLSFSMTGKLVATGGSLRGFEIAAENREFHPATATIEGNSVRISSTEVDAPVAVRYNWKNWADGNLSDATALPAAPFRTDSWPRY